MKYTRSFFMVSVLLKVISMHAEPATAKLICLNNIQTNPTTVFLFAHGIDYRSNTCNRQAQAYIDSNIITTPCYTFDFGDGRKTLNFGQEDDCQLLADAYTQVIQKHPDAKIILAGLSRGAVTILNTLANHPELDWSRVPAIILESPYAEVGNMAEQIASSYLFFIPFKRTLMRKLINALPNYDPEGTQPIDMIEQIGVHIPMFIGYIQADKVVPPEGTRALIAKLRSADHQVTAWPAHKGRHSTLATDAGFAQAAQEFLRKNI